MTFPPVYLVSAVRSPIGRFGGGLASVPAVDLGTAVARSAISRSGLEPADFDEVIFAHARQAGCGPNPARQVGHNAGLPDEVPAFTVNDLNDTVVAFLGEPRGTSQPVREQVVFTQRALPGAAPPPSRVAATTAMGAAAEPEMVVRSEAPVIRVHEEPGRPGETIVVDQTTLQTKKEYYGQPVSLDLKDERSGPVVLAEARAFDAGLFDRMWLCHHDIELLVGLRNQDADVKLVNSTRLHRIEEGPERRAAQLAAEGIDGVNMRNQDWNGGLVALFHRFGRMAFAWDLQFEHHLRPAYRMGVDAVFSDHVDRMVDSFRAELGSGPPNPTPD